MFTAAGKLHLISSENILKATLAHPPQPGNAVIVESAMRLLRPDSAAPPAVSNKLCSGHAPACTAAAQGPSRTGPELSASGLAKYPSPQPLLTSAGTSEENG